MTYATLLAHLDPGQENAAVLRVAGDLSERFQANVVGVGAHQLQTAIYSDVAYSGPLLIEERAAIDREMTDLETAFRQALGNRAAGLEWRSCVGFGSASGYVAAQARLADLLITGTSRQTGRSVKTSDLVMAAGRPVLTVPFKTATLNPDCIVIAWKDTREARRAARDALPFLKRATTIIVVEIAAPDEVVQARARIEDVARWLQRHGLRAETVVSDSGETDSSRLQAIAREHKAGIIVAGAYGHSRAREWMLGGVTHDLLLGTEFCSLLSH